MAALAALLQAAGMPARPAIVRIPRGVDACPVAGFDRPATTAHQTCLVVRNATRPALLESACARAGAVRADRVRAAVDIDIAEVAWTRRGAGRRFDRDRPGDGDRGRAGDQSAEQRAAVLGGC